MLGELRKTCRGLLRDGSVDVVIGYGQTEPGAVVHPVFITREKDADLLTWNQSCHVNLVTYLNRADVRAIGRPAIVVKACDERSLVVLQRESQVRREAIYVIGMACDGVDQPRTVKCESCATRVPRFADRVIGTGATNTAELTDRYAPLDQLIHLPINQRMQHWQAEFSRCTKCYACRQVCPLCYCTRCIVDKNRPVTLDTSATLKGNFAWHITRAFHLAGRCVGCDECTRVCPAGIDLRLLNLSLARAAEEHFRFTAGEDPTELPLIGTHSESDQETFIR